ncbi:DNA polymerase Y family protein [Sulfuriroseicoccus oceanibius]|uniref:Uncharacterized protein n=1 Tax=Sulfuriroseicoccus oceanibius TaxID=2707525 RepID=A0A6B3LBS6_9BACT|nr:hypothetical protein [Sulfuriroseicoccus oceanibius]QQL43983.1 hypothetical protein G3M56_008755 [Sulfuriroseicoccus oceanibius]
MFAAIHIPQLPLVVRIHTESDWDDHHRPVLLDQPVVLLNLDDPESTTERQRDRAHVLHANDFAHTQFGIEPGMTTTRALARCPDELILFTRRPDLEKETHLALLAAANDLSPDLESTTTGSVIADLSTLPDALRSPRDWTTHAIDSVLARLGLPIHLAIATTPDLALLAATAGPPLATTYNPYQQRTPQAAAVTNPSEFSPIPISHLPGLLEYCGIPSDTAAELTSLFLSWGLRTIGDFTALPRTGLADRLGSAAAWLHDTLTARHCRLLKLFHPADSLARHTDLEFPIHDTEPLLFLLGRMLGTVCARLESSHQHVAQLHLALHYESAQRPPYEHTINLPEPTANRSHLLDALHYHLESFTASAPISGVTLDATPVVRSAKQQQLFERALKDPARFAITLTKLEALLGKGRIGAPVTDNSHRPDTASACPWFLHQPAMKQPELTPEMTCGIPLRRFRPPIPITVATESTPNSPHPVPTAVLSGPVTGAIRARRGPTLISGHWWDPTSRWHHTEWDVELPRQSLVRITHHNHQWHLAGTY